MIKVANGGVVFTGVKKHLNNADTSICLLLASFGSFFSSLGLVLMKYAHVKTEKAKKHAQSRSVFCSIIWITGLISLILGSVFNIVALRVGNQFLLSSTCALSIIFNTLLSVCFLKESIQ